THESNKDFYEKAWARPRTVEDTAPTTNKPMFDTVADKKVLSDRTRTVELYFLNGHQHHSGQLIAYLPKERILMYGDAYNPPAGGVRLQPDLSDNGCRLPRRDLRVRAPWRGVDL